MGNVERMKKNESCIFFISYRRRIDFQSENASTIVATTTYSLDLHHQPSSYSFDQVILFVTESRSFAWSLGQQFFFSLLFRLVLTLSRTT